MPHTEYLAGLSRLVTLFANAAAGDEDRLSAVRTLVALARERALEMDVAPGSPTGAGVDDVTQETAKLLGVLRAHRVRRLVIRRGTGPRELAQLAGLLARANPPAPGAADDSIQRGLDELHIWGVRLDLHMEEGALIAALPPELRAAVETAAATEEPADVDRAYAAVASAFHTTRSADATASDSAARVTRALVCLFDAHPARARTPAAEAHRAGVAKLVEAELESVVRAVAEGTVPEGWRVVRAAADQGVRLLINRLGDADTIEERRRCFNAILDVGGSLDPLLDGLRDPRWYVVRNVALVLGELHEPAAVRPLARALQGADDRVRHAAAQALTRIDGPGATHALVGALRDPSAPVRLLAARALQRAPEHRVSVSPAMIMARLSLESDLSVAQELVSALRAIGTAEAHAALTLLAAGVDGEPTGPLDGAAGVEALRTLGQLPRPRLVQTLRDFAQSADPHLRRAALRVARRLVARAA